MNRTVTFSEPQWLAIEKAAKLGIFAADLLGPDDPQWAMDNQQTQDAHDALALVVEHSKDQLLDRVRLVRIEPPAFPGSQRGIAEGWYLDFDECADAYRVYALEGSGKHKDDKHALAFVTGKAALGSQLHQDALDWIEAANAMHDAALAVPPVVKLEKARPAALPVAKNVATKPLPDAAQSAKPARSWGLFGRGAPA